MAFLASSHERTVNPSLSVVLGAVVDEILTTEVGYKSLKLVPRWGHRRVKEKGSGIPSTILKTGRARGGGVLLFSPFTAGTGRF